jgi:hypothetical protein
MLCATTACSDSDNDEVEVETDSTDVVELATTPLTISSDQASLSSRVRNYSAAGVVTRADAASITDVVMPAEPTPATMPSDTIFWKDQVELAHAEYNADGSYKEWVGKKVNGYNCVVPVGEYFEDTKVNPYAYPDGQAFCDGNYYIRGEAKLDFHWCSTSSGINVYVMTGGKLTITGSIPWGVHVYVYGDIDVTAVENLVNGGWNAPNSAGLFCVNDLDLGDTKHTMNSGTLYVGGALTGDLHDMPNGAWVIMNCGSHITGTFNINSYSSVDLRGNLTVDDNVVTSSGTKEIYMKPGVLLKANAIKLNNDEIRVVIDGDDEGYAYIQADSIYSNGLDLTTKFDGYFAISCPAFLEDSKVFDVEKFQFVAQVKVNSAITEAGMTIPTSCGGNTPETPTKEVPVLETISDITPDATHTHPISATGIDVANGKIYVSWHWRGVNYHGCVEIGEMTATGLKLDQFFETPASESKQVITDASLYGKDFNHIMVDPIENRSYVVGNEAKGGFLAYVDLNANGLVADGGALSYRRLLGGDGNCIIRNGDYMQVASTYGYESYVLPKLDRVGRNPQPGKAKFITKVGGKLYGMHFNTDVYTDAEFVDTDKTSKLQKVGITVDSFDGFDYTFENGQTALSTTYEVSPIDGKNVVTVDETTGDVYVCRGAYGITRLSDGATFQLSLVDGKMPRGYANGSAVDANYVYVAYGSAGIYVLNKSDLSVVTKYTYVGGNSANYVKVPGDGYIYVAYGENGWQVYRLTTTQVAVSK